MSESESLATIKYNGIHYKVRADIPIIDALQQAGKIFIRGISCKHKICGACSIVFKRKGELRLNGGLACQELSEDGMEIEPANYSGSTESKFNPRVDDPINQLINSHPEINECINCNECNQICPTSVNIKGVLEDIKRWDILESVSRTSECVTCGLCSMICPVDIRPELIAMQAKTSLSFALLKGSSSEQIGSTEKNIKENKQLEYLCNLCNQELEQTADKIRDEILNTLKRQ